MKLIFRGVFRHRRSTLRLFVLLAASSASVLFCLAFRDSFTSRYRQLAIDSSTAHLQILPPDSPKVQEMAFADQREGLVLLDFSPDLQQYLASLSEVTGVMLAIETQAAVYSMEGEPTGFTPSLIGVDTRSFGQTLPGVSVVEGEPDLAWKEGLGDIPVFRPPLEFWEVIRDNDRFARKNFRLTGSAWEEFKSGVIRDFPALFPTLSSDAGGAAENTAFLAGMNAALERADLASLLPERTEEGYDYAVDDAMAALRAASEKSGASASVSPRSAFQLRVLRKRLLQSLYPDAITPVRETIDLNIPYTMAVPAARGDDPLARPQILPIRITAYVRPLPMFFYNYYIDSRVLRDRLGLGPRAGTSIYVRLRSIADTQAARKAIETWLVSHGMDYRVRDYAELGQLYLSTSTGFRAITLILIVLFITAVTIFVVNTVLLSLVRRRREIGTAIALGLSPTANIGVLFGEMLALVTASWALGSVVGTLLVVLFHSVGVPGIIFMPGNRLILDFRPVHLLVSMAVLVTSSAAAALVPLLRLARTAPVELLKEAA